MISPGEVRISIDQEAVKEYIKKQLDQNLNEAFWFIDIKKMSELTCMSVRWLEQEITSDVRMRAIQRQKSRKRLWPAKQALEIIEQITSEW